MKPKAFTLLNTGMNRDLSISKTGESSAYENHNIRILARDDGTMLSVTNERGNQEIDIRGITEFPEDAILIGWNVLNNHIILFFTNDNGTDWIYRIDYTEGDFVARFGSHRDRYLYRGNLNFSSDYPIESIVYQESEDIQKIYWVDGRNVLRFMNIMATDAEVTEWEHDDTYTCFDSNRVAELGISVKIKKDDSGSTRANGVIQYLVTYFNKHGQETGFVWVSDLVYLSPYNIGGSADSTNSNRVTLEMSNLDTRFTSYRVYSVFRSAYDGTVVAYLVSEGDTASNVVVVDDGAHLETEDAARLLYLGSIPVIAGTLTHKDQTLFLGDLKLKEKKPTTLLENTIRNNMFLVDGYSSKVTFIYSDNRYSDRKDIPYVKDEGIYLYSSQLEYTSSQISTFKGGEKYRFALSFRRADGTWSEAFWIGDAINNLYPQIDASNGTIKRAIAQCEIPPVVAQRALEAGFGAVQLMIAEATYADRSIKAQGIVNPTMFNVWDRYSDRLYSQASWITRPRNSDFAWQHFDVVKKSTTSTGEIACNYWTGNTAPTPYYRIRNYGTGDAEYTEDFSNLSSYTHLMILYEIRFDNPVWSSGRKYSLYAYLIFGTADPSKFNDMETIVFDLTARAYMAASVSSEGRHTSVYSYESDDEKISYTVDKIYVGPHGGKDKIEKVTNVRNEMVRIFNTYYGYIGNAEDLVPDVTTMTDSWLHDLDEGTSAFYNYKFTTTRYTNLDNALNSTATSARWWYIQSSEGSSHIDDEVPSYYKKHLMFVDENTVTLNSPEFDYEAVSIDLRNNSGSGNKFRIVGVAKLSASMSDYTVDATPGKQSGENLIQVNFNSSSVHRNLLAWPLWRETALAAKQPEQEGSGDEEGSADDDYVEPENRTSDYYVWSGGTVDYWLYMWGRRGNISGYTPSDGAEYSVLRSKVFANLRYSYATVYNNRNDSDYPQKVFTPESIRTFNYTNSQYLGMRVNSGIKYYDAFIQSSLFVPDALKYPICYSSGNGDVSRILDYDGAYLFTSEPVQMDYASNPHAVITLPTTISNGKYTQQILPYLYGFSGVTIPTNLSDTDTTGALLPWIDNTTTGDYPYIDYAVSQSYFKTPASVTSYDQYLYIGEIYYDYEGEGNDTRYGGISDAAVQNNRFVIAGPQYPLSENGNLIYGNQGDTYFQRWDCLKTKPISGAENGVIDIASVMVETHINIDGRTDRQRGISKLASLNTDQYGSLNRVYSQPNNYLVSRDLDDDMNQDTYHSTITWTLDKADSSQVDEWTHITLANNIKLDGDKGQCRSLNRFGNSIIAFQDKGIAEVLFNSRTQLSTTDGVPVEIANSGKVDGIRYISNKYGCMNKWSIVEGKNGLYFVDNINQSFCAFNGQVVESLSMKLGFDVWFRDIHRWKTWTPTRFDNVVSYYDKIHSDIYLVRRTSDNMPCLVYSEKLNAFTSFFDYNAVPMMANVEDRFISFKNRKLWMQNTGSFCNFFGEQFDFWAWYRVAPEPFSDKVWTNIEYRADVYNILDENGNQKVPAGYSINADRFFFTDDLYKENDTFTTYRMWNEYQTTGDVTITANNSYLDVARKKFRIWRISVARALKHDANVHGLDRIRNPWVNLMFKKEVTDNKNLMQLHDIVVKYYE